MWGNGSEKGGVRKEWDSQRKRIAFIHWRHPGGILEIKGDATKDCVSILF